MAYFDFEPEERFRNTWSPVVDVCERQEAFIIRAELPGVRKDDIRLHWRNGVLTIAGSKRRQASEPEGSRYLCVERQHGRFRRDVALHVPIDFQKAEAELRDGLLQVRLPKMMLDTPGDSSIPIK